MSISQLYYYRGQVTLDFQQRCQAITTGLYFRGSCFVYDMVSGGHNPSNDLGNACTHMNENGFLALITGKTLLNMINALAVGILYKVNVQKYKIPFFSTLLGVEEVIAGLD